jgi:hypothetical protein
VKRPERIKIIGKWHRLEFLPSITEGEDTFAGRIDHDRQTIKIEDGQTLESEQDTILHEVMHGIERAMDLEIPETVIHRMATGLIAVLKDNPAFIRYLSSNNKKRDDAAATAH